LFFTYGASVLLISAAIYGIFRLGQDLWTYYCRGGFSRQPAVSFLILIKDMEADVEFFMRELIERLEQVEFPVDAVVVDCGSEDLTYDIAVRIADLSPAVEVVSMPDRVRPVNETMPLCRGTVIHVLDSLNRLAARELIAVVDGLLGRPVNECEASRF
jgi:hypothetical protein